MLYDPKWKAATTDLAAPLAVSADEIVALKLREFAAFVALKAAVIPNNRYEWDDPDHCPVGQWLHATGCYRDDWDEHRTLAQKLMVHLARGNTRDAKRHRWTWRALHRRVQKVFAK